MYVYAFVFINVFLLCMTVRCVKCVKSVNHLHVFFCGAFNGRWRRTELILHIGNLSRSETKREMVWITEQKFHMKLERCVSPVTDALQSKLRQDLFHHWTQERSGCYEQSSDEMTNTHHIYLAVFLKDWLTSLFSSHWILALRFCLQTHKAKKNVCIQ